MYSFFYSLLAREFSTLFTSSVNFFQNYLFKKVLSWNTIRVSNSLNPDQDDICRSWSGSKLTLFTSSVDFFQNYLFKKILSWNTIRVSNSLNPDKDWHLSVLIRVQTVCKGYQQTSKFVVGRQRANMGQPMRNGSYCKTRVKVQTFVNPELSKTLILNLNMPTKYSQFKVYMANCL